MPDVFTKAKRSDVMSRIRGRGKKDKELALMRVFRAQGITGWRRHVEVKVKKKSTSPQPMNLPFGVHPLGCPKCGITLKRGHQTGWRRFRGSKRDILFRRILSPFEVERERRN